MTYTIKIQDDSAKAKSIINMLKALKDDYDFIEIKKEKNKETVLDRDLENRYIDFQSDKTGKSWDDLKKELI